MTTFQSEKNAGFLRRRGRIRSIVSGTAERPRLSVSRSVRHIYAQLIDDVRGVTLAAAHDTEVKGADKLTKVQLAEQVGTLIADKAKKLNITTVVFDRGGRVYQGRVKAVADGARSAGLAF